MVRVIETGDPTGAPDTWLQVAANGMNTRTATIEIAIPRRTLLTDEPPHGGEQSETTRFATGNRLGLSVLRRGRRVRCGSRSVSVTGEGGEGLFVDDAAAAQALVLLELCNCPHGSGTVESVDLHGESGISQRFLHCANKRS